MKMKTLLLTAVLALSSMSALAQTTINTRDLSEEQIAQLALQAAQMKNGTGTGGTSETIRREAEAWGELGANMGRAAVGAAKELGVAANDFIQTPAGKITMGVVIWKLIGEDILSVLVGGSIFIVGYALAFYMFFFARYADYVKYDTRPILWGLMNKRYVVEIREDDENRIVRVVIACVATVMTTIVGLVVIF